MAIKLNTYRLSVTFAVPLEDGSNLGWWLKVLARNVEDVTTFIRPEQEIQSLVITLLETDVAHRENDNFACKILDENTSPPYL